MSKHWAALAGLAIGLATISTPVLAGVNLVTNGAFATGLTGWDYTSVGATSAAAVITITPDPLTSGSPDPSSGAGVYFTTDTGYQTLSQTISLGVGTYSIGFDLYVPLTGNPFDATFAASIAGTSLLSSASVAQIGSTYGTNIWVTLASVADVAAAGMYDVDFTFTGSGVPAKDVVITRTFVVAGDVLAPEPASFVLLAGSILGLGGVRRRRSLSTSG
jgi:hypothetical protein